MDKRTIDYKLLKNIKKLLEIYAPEGDTASSIPYASCNGIRISTKEIESLWSSVKDQVKKVDL